MQVSRQFEHLNTPQHQNTPPGSPVAKLMTAPLDPRRSPQPSQEADRSLAMSSAMARLIPRITGEDM